MKKLVLLLMFSMLVLAPFNAHAGISIALTLDRQEATLSDSIRMVVSVSGARSCDSPPVIEGLDLFRVTHGGSSSRVEIINSRVSSGVDYTYYLTPSKTGTFQIGPARATVNGRNFQSNIVSLTIARAASSASPAKGPIFLTAALSSKKAYIEEQILYTLKLYLKARVSNISLQLPEQDHLTFQQLNKPREYQGVIDGSRYQIVEIRYALMGLKDGNYRIQPARMDMTVYDSRQPSKRGFFDDPFFSDPFFRRGRPVTVSNEPLELKVVPLPSEGKPDGFSGLVGSFRIESQLSPAKIRVGESATLTVRVSGRGNVNRIPDLKMPSLDHTKVYADEPVFAAGHDLKGLSGSKTMKWAIVPELPVDYEIPPLSFSFFDPKAGRYRVLQTTRHSLAVIPGKGKMIMVEAGTGTQKGADRPAKQEIKEIGHDILPLHASVREFGTGSRARTGGPFLWITLFLPVLLYLSTFLGLRLKRRSVKTLPAQRARRAAKDLIRHCRQERGDANSLNLAVRDYFNNRFGLALASLTPEDATEILTAKGVTLKTAQKLKQILIEVEDTIYTGTDKRSVSMGEEIPGIVRKIEKEIR